MQLLFCNTYVFDSQGTNGNWAVIKFPCMVAVDEIRIVPPGVKTHSQLLEDQFVGKTSPNKFRIEFFSDDRSASMTTYEHVGSMEYIEGSPNRFHPPSALYSEKLLLNGWFNQITIAVYGGILSDVGTTPPPLDLNLKTPSLIIHEKPEGRSVYIRGVQDVPQLTKDVDKPEPLMASFPSAVDPKFLGRGKPFADIEEDAARNVLDDFGFQDEDIGMDDIPAPYFDRRQQRNKAFGMEGGRALHKNYNNIGSDYSRGMAGRMAMHPGIEPDGSFRNDDRFSYKDKNKGFQFTHPRHHARNETIDNSELSNQKHKQGNEWYSQVDRVDSKKNQRPSQDKSESKDLRQSLERNRDESEATGVSEKDPKHWMDGGYEEISDEEIEEERVASLQDMEDLMDVELLGTTSTMCFNPFLMDPFQLIHFNHPDMTEFEVECNNLLLQQDDHNIPNGGYEVDVARFESLFTKARKIGRIEYIKSDLPTLSLDAEQGKEWVAIIEEFIPLVSSALPVIGVTQREKYEEYVQLLITWVLTGLDSTLASTQAIGTNLRMLKCGIGLANKLCCTTQDIVAYFTTSKLDTKLISLLQVEHMASSMKIMIVHTLDAYLSWPSSMSAYLNEEEDIPSENYSKLIQVVLKPQAARVAAALSRIVNKITLFHSMWRLKMVVFNLVTEKIPNAEDEYYFDDDYIAEDIENDIVEEEVVMEEEEMVVMSSTSNDEEEDDMQNDESHFHHRSGRKVRHDENREFVDKSSESDVQHISVSQALSEDTTVPLEAAICTEEANITDTDINNILESLRLMTHTIQNIKSTIAQLPKRVFPTKSNLDEIADGPALGCMFRMMEFFQVLPAIQGLLCTPVLSSIQNVYEAAYKLLDLLMSRQDGLLYLASNFNSLNCIARHLLCSTPNLATAEIGTIGTAAHLGIKLAIHIQCIQCIDQLKMFPESDLAESAAEECVEILRMLYSLTYETFGKHWIAKILSMDDNILPILACIQQTKKEIPVPDKENDKEKNEDEKVESDEKNNRKKLQRKSAASGYAMHILLTMLKMSQKVSHLLLHRDLVLGTIKGAPLSHIVEEVQEWLRPLEALKEGKDSITGCMEFMKLTFEKLEWNTLMTSGPGLCTSLRYLCHASEAKHPHSFDSSSMTSEKISMPVYRTILQIFSCGGISVLVEGLEKLNKCFVYPCYSQHSLTTILSSSFHNLVTTLSENLLLLIVHLLKVLLNTPEGKFKPDHLINLLVHHYAGMHTVLRESCTERLDIITEMVVSILSLFLRNTACSTLEEEAVGERNRILSEVISSIQEHCQSMVPGMVILSHLLPLPLPVTVTDEESCEDVVKSVLKERDAWQELLHSVLEELSSVLSVACHSTCLPWLEVLIPLVQQISDLSPNLSLAMINMVLDTCIIVSKSITETENAEEKPIDIEEYTYNAHQLFILSEIVMKESSKATLISIINNNERDSLNVIWKKARDQSNDRSSRFTQAALRLASILLYPAIALLPKTATSEDTNSLPDSHLKEILGLAVEGLNSTSLETIGYSLYCLTSLISNESWYTEIRALLVKHSSTLNNVLETLLRRWTREYMQSVVTLLDFCVFLQSLCNPGINRSSFLTKAEMRSVLRWNKEFAGGTHPLISLKVKLEGEETDDDIVNTTLDEVTVLCQTLKTSHVVPKAVDAKENKNLKDKKFKPITLEEQFAKRPIVVCDQDDLVFVSRLGILQGNAEFSFSSKNIKSKSSVAVSLVDMAEKFCTGFSLEKSLKELTESAKTTDIDKIRIEAKAKRLKKMETFSMRHGKTLTYMKRSHGLTGPTPRGRGRGRGSSFGRHNDLFRQRKQNTSRPPSMHVDDFVAADEGDDGKDDVPPPSPPPPTFISSRRTARPFKRDYVPRGRGNRGSFRGFGRGNFSANFVGSGANIEPLSSVDKFRNRNLGGRIQDRFPRGRGRGRDPTRSFSPRDNFKGKPPQSWSFSNTRNFGGNFSSPGGFRGGRAKALMKIGRPLLGPPPLGMNKWGGMAPRRGRGYGKPRGKHLRSFTR